MGRILASDGGRTFTYAYWDQLDRVAHEHGVGGEATADELAAIDRAFARLLDIAAGTDTLVVVTADHGFVDVAPERWILLEAHPELARMLVLPLCGEPRTAYCYVRPDCHHDFAAYVGAELADAAVAVASRQLLELRAYGPGPDHPHLARRVGDFALLMRDGWAIRDWLPGEQRHPKIGVHGGASAAELHVPLIVTHL